MLQPKLKLHSIKKDAKEFYLQDITGNFGDIYQVKNPDGTMSGNLTNNWGYGGENPARDTLAVIFGAVHHKKKEDIWIDPLKYNPTDPTVEKVTFPYPMDGHHEFFMFLLPVFVESGIYEIGSIIFFPDGNDTIYMGAAKELMADGSWEKRTMAELAANYDGITYRYKMEDLLYAKSYLYFGEVNDKRMEKIIASGSCEKKDNYSLRREYELTLMLREIKAAKCNGYFLLGEAYVSAIEKFIKE